MYTTGSKRRQGEIISVTHRSRKARLEHPSVTQVTAFASANLGYPKGRQSSIFCIVITFALGSTTTTLIFHERDVAALIAFVAIRFARSRLSFVVI